MKVYYGSSTNKKDITPILEKKAPIILKPDLKIRNLLFDTPAEKIGTIYIENSPNLPLEEYPLKKEIIVYKFKGALTVLLKDTIQHKLSSIHKTLKIKHGNFKQEYPEQEMSALFISPTDKVLELGGNIGRNSLVISRLLQDSSNLTVLESHPDNVKLLEENKKINSLSFSIIRCALSKRRLIQKGWYSYPLVEGQAVPPDFIEIPIIQFDELKQKIGHPLTTLVADCEGALYYILLDFPNFFNEFTTVIMENDFKHIDHKEYVDRNLKSLGFEVVYVKDGGNRLCGSCFYQVWKR
jgi:FkbM family methyltransferase